MAHSVQSCADTLASGIAGCESIFNTAMANATTLAEQQQAARDLVACIKSKASAALICIESAS